MRFSVIVPAYNAASHIRRCVSSIYGSEFDPTDYEVLVVDNGSTDGTDRYAAQSGARVVSEPRPNRSRARNLGASVARGDWLVFTDADCEVNARWLAELDAAIDKEGEDGMSGPLALMAGKIESPQPPASPILAASLPSAGTSADLVSPSISPVQAYIALRGWLDQEKFLAGAGSASPPFAATANLAVRKDAFARIGGFDETLTIAGEDADLCWRAASQGFEIRYVPEARVVHHHRATIRAMMRQAYDYGRANAELFAKHRASFGKVAHLNPRFFLWSILGLVKAPLDYLSGRDDLAKRLGWYDFLANGAQALGRVAGAWRSKVFFV